MYNDWTDWLVSERETGGFERMTEVGLQMRDMYQKNDCRRSTEKFNASRTQCMIFTRMYAYEYRKVKIFGSQVSEEWALSQQRASTICSLVARVEEVSRLLTFSFPAAVASKYPSYVRDMGQPLSSTSHPRISKPEHESLSDGLALVGWEEHTRHAKSLAGGDYGVHISQIELLVRCCRMLWYIQIHVVSIWEGQRGKISCWLSTVLELCRLALNLSFALELPGANHYQAMIAYPHVSKAPQQALCNALLDLQLDIVRSSATNSTIHWYLNNLKDLSMR